MSIPYKSKQLTPKKNKFNIEIYMLQLNFSPFPILESERLCFRKLTITDAPEILLLRGNPETMKYIPRPLITDIDGALATQSSLAKNPNGGGAVLLIAMCRQRSF